MCIFSVCLGFQSFVNKGSLTDCIQLDCVRLFSCTRILSLDTQALASRDIWDFSIIQKKCQKWLPPYSFHKKMNNVDLFPNLFWWIQKSQKTYNLSCNMFIIFILLDYYADKEMYISKILGYSLYWRNRSFFPDTFLREMNL